jgi:hypothetical protein
MNRRQAKLWKLAKKEALDERCNQRMAAHAVIVAGNYTAEFVNLPSANLFTNWRLGLVGKLRTLWMRYIQFCDCVRV